MAVRQVYFLSATEDEANVADNELPVVVNSTGIEYYYAPFTSRSFRHDYSFVNVKKGTLFFEFDNMNITLNEGEFIIIPPETAVKFGTDCSILNYFWLQFTGKEAQKLFENTHLSTKKKYHITMPDKAENIITEIFNEFIINDEFFHIKTAAMLTEFFVLLSRNIYTQNRALMKSVEYIHKNYDKNLSVSMLAKTEHISVSHYRAIFKDRLGVSPIEYITNLRLNVACHYLSNTTYSIAEISQKTGYSDPLYFSRIFKEKIGVTASEYRKRESADF